VARNGFFFVFDMAEREEDPVHILLRMRNRSDLPDASFGHERCEGWHTSIAGEDRRIGAAGDSETRAEQVQASSGSPSRWALSCRTSRFRRESGPARSRSPTTRWSDVLEFVVFDEHADPRPGRPHSRAARRCARPTGTA